MVGVHPDDLYRRRLWVDKPPCFATVLAAPETGSLSVHYVLVLRIENKKLHDASQVEHTPGLPAVMGDVSPGHVATDQNCIRVMRTDHWVEHRAPSARSNNLEIARSV